MLAMTYIFEKINHSWRSQWIYSCRVTVVWLSPILYERLASQIRLPRGGTDIRRRSGRHKQPNSSLFYYYNCFSVRVVVAASQQNARLHCYCEKHAFNCALRYSAFIGRYLTTFNVFCILACLSNNVLVSLHYECIFLVSDVFLNCVIQSLHINYLITTVCGK